MKCYDCGKEPLTKDEVGINKKLAGKKVNKFFCIECFSNQLGVTTEELLDKIEEFKTEGCILFG